jgi:hypothetical protein
VAAVTPENAAAFLGRLVDQSAQTIVAVTTDMDPTFTDWKRGLNENIAAIGSYPFAVSCRARGVVHARSPSLNTKPPKIGSQTSKSEREAARSIGPSDYVIRQPAAQLSQKRRGDTLLSPAEAQNRKTAHNLSLSYVQDNVQGAGKNDLRKTRSVL